MGNLRWYIITAASLILASVTGFVVQLHFFHRTNDTFFYLLQDLAFLPVQALLVTLVVNRWFQVRERGELIRKTNMVVGIFFTEMGSTLLRYFSEFDTNLAEMKKIADIKPEWTDRDFTAMKKRLQHLKETYPYIFSLMVRTDPFAPHPSAVIGEEITRPSG